jgi:hypothetical protein
VGGLRQTGFRSISPIRRDPRPGNCHPLLRLWMSDAGVEIRGGRRLRWLHHQSNIPLLPFGRRPNGDWQMPHYQPRLRAWPQCWLPIRAAKGFNWRRGDASHDSRACRSGHWSSLPEGGSENRSLLDRLPLEV